MSETNRIEYKQELNKNDMKIHQHTFTKWRAVLVLLFFSCTEGLHLKAQYILQSADVTISTSGEITACSIANFDTGTLKYPNKLTA